MSVHPLGVTHHDPKAWARRIIARALAGESVNKCTLQMARNALAQGGRG